MLRKATGSCVPEIRPRILAQLRVHRLEPRSSRTRCARPGSNPACGKSRVRGSRRGRDRAAVRLQLGRKSRDNFIQFVAARRHGPSSAAVRSAGSLSAPAAIQRHRLAEHLDGTSTGQRYAAVTPASRPSRASASQLRRALRRFRRDRNRAGAHDRPASTGADVGEPTPARPQREGAPPEVGMRR